MQRIIIAIIFKSSIFKSSIFMSSILLLFPSLLSGQFEATTATGLVGEKICINISFPDSIIAGTIVDGETVSISGDFHLSNPTVFYPENFTIPEGYSMIKTGITRLSDSTYKFTLSFQIDRIINDKAEFMFCGEALAGSDSLCIITFSGLILNDISIRDFEAIVKIYTISGTIPYIQFPRITNIYPNPVGAKDSFTVQYYNYKKMDTKFFILNVARQEKLIKNIKSLEPGFHEFTYTPGRNFAAGAYWVIMITKMGWDFKGVVVIK